MATLPVFTNLLSVSAGAGLIPLGGNNNTWTANTAVAGVAAKTLVFIIVNENLQTSTSFSDGTANPYTGVAGVAGGRIWYCLNPANGFSIGATMTAIIGGNSDRKWGGLYQADQVCTFEGAAGATGSSNQPTVTGPSMTADTLVFGGSVMQRNATATIPGGWTSLYNATFDSRIATLASFPTTGTGTVTYNPLHNDNASWAAVLAGFKGSGGAAASPEGWKAETPDVTRSTRMVPYESRRRAMLERYERERRLERASFFREVAQQVSYREFGK